jgi:spermidine synthase
MAGIFLLSGMASLMDQVVWLRYLGLIFGNTTWATATLLAVFMGGLGLGALLFGRWADRLTRPLALYAGMEAAIALLALASPTLLSWIDAAYVLVYRSWGNLPWLFAIGRTLLVACFLLPPTVLMGGTLPLVLRATSAALARVGWSSGLFYGVNTVGAVLGTAVAGFYSIWQVGLYRTLVIAAALNLVAAAGSLLLSRRFVPFGDGRQPGAGGRRRRSEGTHRWLVGLFFAMGATSLAYEVLWTRILLFHLGSSVYAYSLMLLLVLVGVGAGSLLASSWVDRLASPLEALVWVELGIGLWIPLQVLLFQQLDLLVLTATELIEPTTFTRYSVGQLLAVLPLLGPPTVLMGLSFPLAVLALNRRRDRIGRDVGEVYGANTLGAVAGSLAAGFVLIPLVGTQNALLLVGSVNALLAASIALRSRAPLLLAPASASVLLVAATILMFPADRVILSAGIFYGDDPNDLAYFHEDAQATVTIRRREKDDQPYFALAVNGVAVAGTSPELDAVQRMQGHLPMLLGDGIRSVVHIGFGSGGTARAVSLSPVDDILVVELSPEVIKASDTYFGDINRGVLADPRVRVEINDGRNFLLASPERFDAVLSDSIHPAYAGNGSLYSLEYFRLIRKRLEPGGVASMWLPTYYITPQNYAGILKAFRKVFPQVAVWYEPSTLNAFTIVTGKADSPAWSLGQLRAAFSIPEIRNDLGALGIYGPADLLPLLLATGSELDPWLDEVPPHTDDRPRVEYESGRLLDRNRTWLRNFARLLELRPAEPPTEYLEILTPIEQQRARLLYRRQSDRLRLHQRLLAERLAALDRRDLP